MATFCDMSREEMYDLLEQLHDRYLSSHRHHEKLPEVTVTSLGNPGFPDATRERP